MSIRRMLMAGTVGESYVYIPLYKRAYIQGNNVSAGRYISASTNAGRIGFFGAGVQAGTYTTKGNTAEYRLPVIKLPKNTASITISFTNTSRLLNTTDVYIYWAKDEPSGTDYPTCAYYVSASSYDARANNSALKTNTLAVPDGADSFVGFFRVYPDIGSTETEDSVASDVGFSITFNKA